MKPMDFCLRKLKLWSKLFLIGLFVSFYFTFVAYGKIETCEQALSDLAAIPEEEFLSLLTRKQGDEAWNLTTELVRRLKNDEFFSMPAMAHTAKKIREKFDDLVANEGCLDETDKEELNYFNAQLDQLEEKNFPYKESLSACFIYSEILFRVHVKQEKRMIKFFDQEIPVYECWRALENEMLSVLAREKIYDPVNRLDVSHEFGCCKDHMDLLDQSTDQYREAIKLIEHDHCTIPWDTRLHRTLIVTLASRDMIFWPTFSEFDIHDFNLVHYLPLAPVGLTTKHEEYHDTVKMCSREYPRHDVEHDIMAVKSGLDMYDPEQRHEHHKLMQKIYLHQSLREKDYDMPVCIIIFETGHEARFAQGEEWTPPFGRIHLEKNIHSASSVRDHLRPRRKYESISKQFPYLRQEGQFSEGFVWLRILNHQCQKIKETGEDLCLLTVDQQCEDQVKKSCEYIERIMQLDDNKIRSVYKDATAFQGQYGLAFYYPARYELKEIRGGGAYTQFDDFFLRTVLHIDAILRKLPDLNMR